MPISKEFKPILHFNNILNTESLESTKDNKIITSDLQLTIIAIIMKSIDSVTTKKEFQNEALALSNTTLHGEENISNLISAVFKAGLENEEGLSGILRGIKIFAIMGIEFILHGIGEFISLINRKVTNLICLPFALILDEKFPIFIIMFTLVFTSILFSAWKMLVLPFILAADILDLVTHSVTRLFDNLFHAPLIAFFFSLIPTVLLAFEFMGLLSLGAVGAIFAWPVIAVVAVGIGMSLLVGSLSVELAKPFEEIFIAEDALEKTFVTEDSFEEISVTKEVQVEKIVTLEKNEEKNQKDDLPSSATSYPIQTSPNIDQGRALRIAAVGAVDSTGKAQVTLDELLQDPNLKNFINNQDPNPQKKFTALHLAVIRYEDCKNANDDRTELFYNNIKKLLKHGASNSIKDSKSKTAFEYTTDADNLYIRLKNDEIENLPQNISPIQTQEINKYTIYAT